MKGEYSPLTQVSVLVLVILASKTISFPAWADRGIAVIIRKPKKAPKFVPGKGFKREGDELILQELSGPRFNLAK